MFQSCVILDSNETRWKNKLYTSTFQSCVILDSNETGHNMRDDSMLFQSCVILDSNETDQYYRIIRSVGKMDKKIEANLLQWLKGRVIKTSLVTKI